MSESDKADLGMVEILEGGEKAELPSEDSDEKLGEQRKPKQEINRLSDFPRAMDDLLGAVGVIGWPGSSTGEDRETFNELAGFLTQVGLGALKRFEGGGLVADIDTAVGNLRRAVELTPDGHPCKPGCLNNLGCSHMRRFERLGEVADIDMAIESQLRAVELTPNGHPEKPGRLNNLGTSNETRFEHFGEMTDIDKAIESHTRAVELTPDGHPNKPGRLNNLGGSQMRRFEHLGEMADIDKAIELQLSAVELTPNGHPHKLGRLSNLGIFYARRFERLGRIADLNKAIESQLTAVKLTPNGHPDKPGRLNGLGYSHRKRFDCLGDMADLNKAIESQLRAVELTPDDHPDKPMRLNNLGTSHMRRFERLGEMADLDKAIEFHLSAIELTPDGHPEKPGCLNNLGISHRTRFERLGEVADIDMAIESQLNAIELTPNGHRNKPGCLNSLGNTYTRRFERFGEMVDLDKAIESHVRAVELTPDGHPETPGCLNNLGISYCTRFEHLGEVADIDKAIKCQFSAAELTPKDHPDKPIYLSNLGTSHRIRFEHLGKMADIDKAIQFQLSVLKLTPDDHSRKPGCLNNLGNSYLRRFESLGEVADIDKAIQFQLNAVELTPDGHPDKPMCLNNLGISHVRRFERLGRIADLDKAIESQLKAVELTPNGHPNKSGCLNNLGYSHETRFERLGEVADIDKAIQFQLNAVELTPDGHLDKPGCLNNLGISHRTRFEHRGKMADIDKAIESQLNAVELTPESHPNKPMYLNDLGISHRTRFERLGKSADLDMAITNFEHCAKAITGPPIVRFRAACAWISALRLKEQNFTSHTPGLEPQHTLINLIPELVWLGAPVYQRFQMIQDIVGSSIHEAVSAAIRVQELELAVEWMEQGRSIVWSQLRRLRSPLVDLHEAHPALAQKFQDVQRSIEMSFLRHDVQDTAETNPMSLEEQAQVHRRDTQKREDLLAEIRGNLGFESFLRPEKFSVLSEACQDRLAVLLTASGGDCDALIVLPSSSITHLSLTNVSQGDISDLHALWESSRVTRLSNRGDVGPALLGAGHRLHTQWDDNLLNIRLSSRGEGPASFDLEPMTSLLSDLWEKIVCPIVEATKATLKDSNEARLPHVTWCPSGPLSFLPLHAAGIYHSNPQDRRGVSDFFVSSYTPSLTALLSHPVQFVQPSMLMVTQPNTPNQMPLPGTAVEAEKIMEKAALNDMQSAIHHLPQSEATVSAVIKQLETHGWVHLACHGIQKFPDPMESSFALHDGALTLASLMQKSMGHAQFAFLSACQTATGDLNLPDEAMHLTSGMLAAGFPSVVGTMWSIGDTIAPEVAEVFYATLFEEGRKSEWKVKSEPAYALHFALQKFRKDSAGDSDLMKWVPFVHYGI
ncbi:TPR-like protein [Flagelloscypha sp. PMI_526]|nr:TPR-like protein [Flagelloscypha sp. PMI_526]